MSEHTVSFRDANLAVGGTPVAVGDTAQDVALADGLASTTQLLGDTAGKIRLISVVPSLDTGVCDAQSRRWNQEASTLDENVVVITVSADLPMAQKRWCGAAGVERMKVLSDYLEMGFGQAYGTWIKDLRLDQRSVFIVDADDTVRYVEYVPVFGQHPDYDAALAALKEVTSD